MYVHNFSLIYIVNLEPVRKLRCSQGRDPLKLIDREAVGAKQHVNFKNIIFLVLLVLSRTLQYTQFDMTKTFIDPLR